MGDNGSIYKGKKTKKIAAMAISIVVFFGAMALISVTVFATAGGTLKTDDSASAISGVLGEKATVSTSLNKLTINVNSDIKLSDPIVLTKSGTVDEVVLNLNGHTITGADGIPDSDVSKAGEIPSHNGGNVIEINGSLDLTVNGGNESTVNTGGSLVGGDGLEGGCRMEQGQPKAGMGYCGGDGGIGIKYLTNGVSSAERRSSNWSYNSDGTGDMPVITIDKGATVKGGNGGNNSTLAFYSFVDGINDYDVEITAGAGGYGIGESNYVDREGTQNTGYTYSGDPVFFALVVDNGTVRGGNGGNMDCTADPTNDYTVGDNPEDTETSQGAGGDGFYAVNGRKYIEVLENGFIKGGAGGSVTQSTCNRLGVLVENEGIRDYNRACMGGCGGNGINLLGDCGRTWTYYDEIFSPDKTLDDGIVISGTVAGGNATDVEGRYTYGGNGGSGIQIGNHTNKEEIGNNNDKMNYVYGDYWNYDKLMGDIIITDTGIVTGGDGANAVWGQGGNGGAGVGTYYIYNDRNTDYINSLIINGTLKSGNGGDARCGYWGPIYNEPSYAWQAGEPGAQGKLFFEHRSFNSSVAKISGYGTCEAGDCGEYYARLESFQVDKFAGAINYGHDFYYGELPDPMYIDGLDNDFKGTTVYGLNTRTAKPIVNDGTKVTITTNVNAGTPSIDDYINCNIEYGSKGQDYIASGGKAYVDWRYEDGVGYLDSGNTVTGETKQLEPHLWGDGPDGMRYTFNSKDGLLEHNRSYGIYCYVALENGVTVRSNTIWFSKVNSPAPPSDVKAEVITQDGKKKIKVSWTGAAATNLNTYAVSRKGSDGSRTGIGYSGATGNDYKNQKVYSSGTSHYLIDSYCSPNVEYTYYVKRTISVKTGTNSYTGYTGPESDGTPCMIGIAAPTGLRGNTTGCAKVKIEWNPVEGAASYYVYRKGASADNYTYVGNSANCTYSDENLIPCETYNYVVKTVQSVTAKGSNVLEVEMPYMYDELDFKATPLSTGTIKLTWNSIDGLRQSHHFEIIRINPDGDTTETHVGQVAGNSLGGGYSLIDNNGGTGLTKGEEYSYRIKLYIGSNQWESDEAVIDKASPKFALTVNTGEQGRPTLSWNKYDGAEGYKIYRKPTGGDYVLVATVNGNDTFAWTDTDSTSGGYTYKVVPFTGSTTNPVEQVNDSSQNIFVKAPSISVDTAKTMYNRAVVNLTGQCEGYDIYRSTSVDGTYNCIKMSITDSASYTDTDVDIDKTYYYKAKGYSVVGDQKIYSGYSQPSAAVSVPVPSVGAPTGLSLSNISYTKLTLTWMQPATGDGCNGYQVYRKLGSDSDGNYNLIKDNLKTETYTDSGLLKNTNYDYKIKSYMTVAGNKYYGSLSAPLRVKTLDYTVDAPTEVTASSNAYDSISLSWTTPVAATGKTYKYEVYYKKATDTDYAKLATDISGTTYNATGLKPCTEYSFNVKSYEMVGDGNNAEKVLSNFANTEATETTESLNIGTPNIASVTINNYTTATVVFSAPTGDNDITGYEIFRNGVSVGTTTTTQFIDNQLEPGATYNYTVKAYFTVNTEKYYGEESEVKNCEVLPVTVIAPSASLSLYGHDDMQFNYSSKGVQYPGYQILYIVKYKKSGGSWSTISSGTTATTVRKADLSDGAAYYFSVQPYTTVNNVKYYGAEKTVSMYALKKVSGVKASKSGTSKIKVKWSNIPGETGYHIYRKTGKHGKWSKVKTRSSSYSSWTDKKKKRGKTYYYKVRAYKYSAGKYVYAPFSSTKHIRR